MTVRAVLVLPSSRSGRGRPDLVRGFTLIELLTAITVAAVLLAVATPSFMRFQKNSELTSTANAFLAAVATARAEAMKRQLNTFLVPCTSASPVCSAIGGTDWTQGWIVYVDADWSSTYSTSGSDIKVAQQDRLPVTVQVTADTSSGGLMFNGAGYLRRTSGTTPTMVALQFGNGTEDRIVQVFASGKTRVCKPDSSCSTSNTF